MGYKLCTAEKPSVARDIAKVIGADKKCDGYYEGNGYRVTWAIGHLVGLAEPSAYGYVSKEEIWDKENNKKEEAFAELPLIPKNFKLVILEKTRKQFDIVKKLMNDVDCDEIIDCGDAGAEGHILQWFIREKAGCRKKVKRFIATSMTNEAIKEAMGNLHNINEFEKVIQGEFCKKKADWIMGMTLSRGASIIYNARVDVGRVQSPTLFFVVKRYLDNINFKSNYFYQFEIEFIEGFKANWIKDKSNLFDCTKDKEGRLLNEIEARNIANDLLNKSGKVTKFECMNKSNKPQLYDITELERDGNRLFGYTAEEVLNVAQSLYEVHKITSYPRTDSRYLTSDLEGYMEGRLREIATIDKYTTNCKEVLEKGIELDNRVINDSKVTDHHAIICTENINNFDISVLDEKEKNILHLIITRMLVTFSKKYLYKETIMNVTFDNGMIFNASGRVTVDLGWKNIQEKMKIGQHTHGEEKEEIIKDFKVGDIVSIKDLNVVKKITVAPKLHTEATLLTAMENAGSQIQHGEILKGKGIGTQATRANIIKSLFDKGYITNVSKSKVKYLIPTKQGISVIKVLPQELYSPQITADWENEIFKITNGQSQPSVFMENFETFIKKEFDKIKDNKIQADFSVKKTVIAKCPWCGGDIVVGKSKNKSEDLYCTNKDCKFSIHKENFIFKQRTGKNLTMAQMKKLIVNGSIKCKCISKANKEYYGIFKIDKNENGYCTLSFGIANKK